MEEPRERDPRLREAELGTKNCWQRIRADAGRSKVPGHTFVYKALLAAVAVVVVVGLVFILGCAILESDDIGGEY